MVGGVEMPSLESGNYEGAISIDLSNLRKVMEIDKTSRAARIQAGILGPDLALRCCGLVAHRRDKRRENRREKARKKQKRST